MVKHNSYRLLLALAVLVLTAVACQAAGGETPATTPAVFVLGLLGDLLGVAPLGVGTLVLLLVYAVALSQRRVFVGQYGIAVAPAGQQQGQWFGRGVL